MSSTKVAKSTGVFLLIDFRHPRLPTQVSLLPESAVSVALSTASPAVAPPLTPGATFPPGVLGFASVVSN